MKLQFSHRGRRYRFDTHRLYDISIPLAFDGPQPNHFDAGSATGEPMVSGDFIGDTRQGGSCNARVLHLNPHCNGTHTECAGHLTDERIAVRSVLSEALQPAVLLTIAPTAAIETGDLTAHPLIESDRLITHEALREGLAEHPRVPAVIVRTTPNDATKPRRRYEGENPTAFFSSDAMSYLVRRGVEHLLVDTPSIDRAHDGGRLATHRIFFGMPAQTHAVKEVQRLQASITELIYVPNDVPDGLYVLNLQVAPFMNDAAPSRPLIFPMELV